MDRPPLVILAGSDRIAGPVPPGAETLHFIIGYKGAEITLDGRCLAGHVLDRFRASECFGEIYLAGPVRVYRDLVDCRIIDTDGNFADNIRESIRWTLRHHGRRTRMGFVTSDILPTPEEIRELWGAFCECPDAVLLYELVERPAEGFGTAGWKPKYQIRPTASEPPRAYLPGHLVVARPELLRLRFIYKLLQGSYRNRNRDLEVRRRVLVRSLLWGLIKQDILNVLYLRAPTLTYNVLRHGLRTFVRLKRNELDIAGLEDGVAHIMLKRRFRTRSVRVIPTDILSFARDIDTEEELREVASDLRLRPVRPRVERRRSSQ